MNSYTVETLIRALAIQAEIEGMKVMNADCERKGNTVPYGEPSFERMSNELKSLADDLYEKRMNGFAV